MRVVDKFLMRFWVAALALSILLPVLSLIDAVKLARKTWGWWHRNPDPPNFLDLPNRPPRRSCENSPYTQKPCHKPRDP